MLRQIRLTVIILIIALSVILPTVIFATELHKDNRTKLIQNGAYGNLKIFDNYSSPALWTTMVTGNWHGIY